MDGLERLYRELQELLRDVEARAEKMDPVPGYTRGYIDALYYVLEVIEDALS